MHQELVNRYSCGSRTCFSWIKLLTVIHLYLYYISYILYMFTFVLIFITLILVEFKILKSKFNFNFSFSFNFNFNFSFYFNFNFSFNFNSVSVSVSMTISKFISYFNWIKVITIFLTLDYKLITRAFGQEGLYRLVVWQLCSSPVDDDYPHPVGLVPPGIV